MCSVLQISWWEVDASERRLRSQISKAAVTTRSLEVTANWCEIFSNSAGVVNPSSRGHVLDSYFRVILLPIHRCVYVFLSGSLEVTSLDLVAPLLQ